MLKLFSKWHFGFLALLLSAVTAFAVDVPSPVTMLQRVADGMISQLEKNKGRLKKPGVIHAIVQKELIPYVALDYMGMSVVGRNYWEKATPEQRTKFIREFTRLVTSTYSAALASYNGDVVQIHPVRSTWQTARVISVQSVIVRRSGQKIPVTYNLVRAGRGWLIYDFSIENVSITRSYRAQFAGVLAQSGMPGLLTRLEAHNRRIQ